MVDVLVMQANLTNTSTQISRIIYMVNPRQSCDAAEIMDQYHTNTSYNHPDSKTPGGISLYSDKVSSQKCVFVRLYICRWCAHTWTSAECHQAITWTNADLKIIGNHSSKLSQKMHKICCQILSSRINILKIFMHLPRANEFILCGQLIHTGTTEANNHHWFRYG